MNDVTRLCDWSGTLTVGCIDLRNVAFRCGIRYETMSELLICYYL